MNFLFSTIAYAEEAGSVAETGTEGTPSTVGSLLYTFLPFILIFAVMYLVLILPQKKKEKKTREMINSAAVGDEITTIGGMTGKIVNVKDDEVTIETSIEKTKMTFKKWSIKEVKEVIKA